VSGATSTSGGPSAAVVVGHFEDAFTLLRVSPVVEALRERRAVGDIKLNELYWQGRSFITADILDQHLPLLVRPSGKPGLGIFALRREVVVSFLSWASETASERPRRLPLPSVELGEIVSVRASRQGALFSDGLGWIEFPNLFHQLKPIYWNSAARDLAY
jgi:hypothetical protein